MTDTTFEWPWQYNFPPFFTIQPNTDTKQKQLDAWKSLILSYYKFNKLYRLDTTEALDQPLFNNRDINRKLSTESLNVILEYLSKTGNVEWDNMKDKKRCFLLWRTFDEWADLIFKWVNDSGMTNTVCTLFELHSGEDTTNEDFHGIDIEVLRKALRVLEKRGNAQIFTAEDPHEEGVKFF